MQRWSPEVRRSGWGGLVTNCKGFIYFGHFHSSFFRFSQASFIIEALCLSRADRKSSPEHNRCLFVAEIKRTCVAQIKQTKRLNGDSFYMLGYSVDVFEFSIDDSSKGLGCFVLFGSTFVINDTGIFSLFTLKGCRDSSPVGFLPADFIKIAAEELNQRTCITLYLVTLSVKQRFVTQAGVY